MKTYICNNCGSKFELDGSNINCPNCGSILTDDNLVLDGINEIDAIIDSVIEEAIEVKESKIININEEEKRILFSDNNKLIERNNDKCIKCGLCKKTCENLANLSYNLNLCENPICTGCGQCILGCPSNALSFKKEYREVKDIMDANEKIVVAIVSPSVYSMVKEVYNIENINDIEKKLVGGLRKLGFDFVFNSSFGSDLLIFEEATEIIERFSKKEKFPFFTSSCPSWIKYMEIYHPELINNVSTCKNPVEIQNEVIKNYFVEKKGFEKDRVVTVSISNCLARKMEKVDNNLDTDYFITSSELALLLSEEEIDLKNVDPSNYDIDVGESSGGGYLLSVSGGHLESLIRTVYRIINKKELAKDEIDIYELRGNEDIREATVQISALKLKVAVVSDMKSLERLLENDLYKKYHLIEVSYCQGGCIGGSGQIFDNNCQYNKLLDERSSDIYLLDKSNQNRYAHNNREIKELYKKYLSNPGSELAKKLLHTSYKDLSILLKNKKK